MSPPCPATAKMPNSLHVVRRLAAIAWGYKKETAALLALQVFFLTLTLGSIGLLGLGVDVLLHTLDATRTPKWPLGIQPPADWPALHQALAIAGAIVLIALLRFASERSLLVLKGRFTAEMQAHLRTRVYDQLQRLDFNFFNAGSSGSLINRVTFDVYQLRMFIDGVLLEALTMGLTLIFFLGWMCLLDWRLTLACLTPLPLVLWLTLAFSRKVKPAYKKNSELLDDATRVITENAQGVHVVKGFGLQAAEQEKFRAASEAVVNHAGWLTRRVAFFTPMVELLTQVPLVILFFYGGWIYCQEKDPATARLSVGILFVFFMLLRRFSGQISVVAQISGIIQQAMNGARRVFEVLDEPRLIVSKPGALAPARLLGEVVLEDVSFGYDAAKPVLHDLRLHIPAGQCVALLGPTGAGKSSLLALISRFHDPRHGRVLLDGHDARDLEVDCLRRAVGVVFQETFLFSTSVADNIAFGRPEATRQDIERAAQLAQADGFIREMADGYDTVLTEGGNGLSGGQRQRIAIARALLTDPAILILDDPTAAIDPGTEREIMNALESAMRGRTVLIVAHRLQTLRRADRVVVLEDGRITAEGTHDALMGKSRHYREVVAVQTA